MRSLAWQRQAGSEVDGRAELRRETASWDKRDRARVPGCGRTWANTECGEEGTDLVLEPSGLKEAGAPHRVSGDPHNILGGELALR